MTQKRTLRRSQLIAPGGVGAIIDILGESFVGMDTTQWAVRRKPLRAPRITAHLGVPELRVPPDATDNSRGIPYRRFPAWLFCGTCRRMDRWSTKQEKEGEAPTCQHCQGSPRMVPMRFVVICGRGHLDDVDWRWWSHSRSGTRDQTQCGLSDLVFEDVKRAGGGLESIQIRCRTCGAKRSLQGIAAPEALRGQKCRGKQPWQYEGGPCDAQPTVVQRGASSVYFPLVSSAIDIPPDSDWAVWGAPTAQVTSNSMFKALQEDPTSPAAPAMIPVIAAKTGVSEAVVRALLNQVQGTSSMFDAEEDLRPGEWRALCNPPAQVHPKDNFIAHREPAPSTINGSLAGLGAAWSELIDDVVVLDRLREIRALRGFHRHTMEDLVPPSLSSKPEFLPAIEVFGEGIFIRLSEEAVSAWASQSAPRERTMRLAKRLSQNTRAKWLEAPTPRSIMIHTLAHLLLREVTYDAGYSASALRERVYIGEGASPMAGLLIYTAAGDSEGSMGGLARLGDPTRLTPILANTTARSQWCSLDPVCRESTAQGPDGLSLAACHACCLLPETSCEQANVLLDRDMLVNPDFGFLASPITALNLALTRNDNA